MDDVLFSSWRLGIFPHIVLSQCFLSGFSINGEKQTMLNDLISPAASKKPNVRHIYSPPKVLQSARTGKILIQSDRIKVGNWIKGKRCWLGGKKKEKKKAFSYESSMYPLLKWQFNLLSATSGCFSWPDCFNWPDCFISANNYLICIKANITGI